MQYPGGVYNAQEKKLRGSVLPETGGVFNLFIHIFVVNIVLHELH